MEPSKAMLEDYRRTMDMMDKKLRQYEALGSPKSIAEKLGVELPEVESKLDERIEENKTPTETPEKEGSSRANSLKNLLGGNDE